MSTTRSLKIALVPVLLLAMGTQARAGSIVGWVNQVVGVDLSKGFIRTAASGTHSLALKADGSVVAWGRNNYSQCNIPPPKTGFVAIAAGYQHSLGLKADGSIVAWGHNADSQATPPAGNDYVAIAAGSYHRLAIKGTAPQIRVLNKRRVGRTVFEYDCIVGFECLWDFAVRDLRVEMVAVPDNMTIIDPEAGFGEGQITENGWITSADTCTFQVDRCEGIDPERIVWKVRCEKAITGQQMELTVAGVKPATQAGTAGSLMMFDKLTDFADLAELSSQWLWTGPAGEIEQDTVPDGTVNLADFAEFARSWAGN